MIDLHCHVLPGIDDGARDIEEAVRMCRMAAADGCEAMVTTPHQRHPYWWNGDRAELDALREQLQERVGPSIQLFPGAEIHVDRELLAEMDQLPASGLVSLAGSRYLLLELDRGGHGPEPVDLMHELLVAGWRPILAHPELYGWLVNQLELISELAAMGVAMQVTAMSVTGDFGRRAQDTVSRLLDQGLVHFVASDAHRVDTRPPGLAKAYEVITRQWGETVAHTLMKEHPKAVLEDRPLETN